MCSAPHGRPPAHGHPRAQSHPPAHDHGHGEDPASMPLPYQVFGAFHKLMRTNRQLMLRRLTEHGAHPGQSFCLRTLAEEDGITQRDLAERLRVARPTVTVMLHKMEKSGLIERRSDENDQRFTRIHLTEAGRALNDEMRRQFNRMIEDVIGPLSEQDQSDLVRLLGALNDNIQAALSHDAEDADDPEADAPGPNAAATSHDVQ